MKSNLLILAVVALLQPAAFAQNIQLKDGKFIDGDKPFVPVVMNYDVQLRYRGPKGAEEVYVSPSHSYFTTPNVKERCADPKDCHQIIASHFKQIKQMGFNTLRIVGHYCYSGYDHLDYPAMWAVGQWWGDFFYPPVMEEADIISEKMPFERHFALVEKILSLADAAGLKVILLIGGKKVDQQAYRKAFTTYLQILAARFKNDKRLLAFDLLNEPEYFHGADQVTPEGGREPEKVAYTKADVRSLVDEWTAAIRSQSNTLITIGLTASGTIFQWDPEVLDVDFLSYHLYPKTGNPNIYEIYFSEIYYLGKSSKKPWIIGETGFSASALKKGKWLDDAGKKKYYPNDGTPEQQLEFARKTAQYCFDCGGLGYSWWQYHEVHWEPDYGVVDSLHGVKPVAQAFADMASWKPNPANCQKPGNYYNATGAKKGGLSKRVKSKDGTPIDNAVIQTNIKQGQRGKTFSTGNGKFKVKGNGFISYIMVSAPGYKSKTIMRLNLIFKRNIKLHPAGCSCKKCD